MDASDLCKESFKSEEKRERPFRKFSSKALNFQYICYFQAQSASHGIEFQLDVYRVFNLQKWHKKMFYWKINVAQPQRK